MRPVPMAGAPAPAHPLSMACGATPARGRWHDGPMRGDFDGSVPVPYGQIYLTSRDSPDMSGAFAGQRNGLCGAGEPGTLFLMTGTHSGRVHLTVEVHDSEPAAAAQEWEEAVEVSFVPRAGTVNLISWGGDSL